MASKRDDGGVLGGAAILLRMWRCVSVLVLWGAACGGGGGAAQDDAGESPDAPSVDARTDAGIVDAAGAVDAAVDGGAAVDAPACTPAPVPVAEANCRSVLRTGLLSQSPTVHTYDDWYAADGLLLTREIDRGTAFAEPVTLTYDDQRRLVSRERRAHRWAYEYDAAGRNTLTKYYFAGDPMPHTHLVYSYDAQDRLIRMELFTPGESAPYELYEYGRDAAGRLTYIYFDEDYPSGFDEGVRFEYDGDLLVRELYYRYPTYVEPPPVLDEIREHVHDASGLRTLTRIDEWPASAAFDEELRYFHDPQARLTRTERWRLSSGEQIGEDTFEYGSSCISACLER